ncbi:MAG: hypothetical protein NXI27_09590 [Alphaproteobacteria bacterium]|nr:hypothetical protein [Alphaproteobacteria bacterium]
MQRIERWFESAANRQNRITTLYSSLVCNKLFPYLRYRLRFLAGLQIIAFAVHVAEFLILLAHAPKLAVVIVLLLRAGSPLIRGAWWGAMEVLRERIRDMKGPGAKDRSEREIANWLVLSLVLSGLLLIAGLAWISWSFAQTGTLGAKLVHVYMALIVLELVTRIPILTMHSGIYAVRRIYRPFLSILLPTLLQGAAIAALYPVMQEGALIVGIVLSSASSLVINYIYIKRMYRIAELHPRLRWNIRRFLSFLAGLPPTNLLWSTMAGFLIRIDSLLVLFLVGLESLKGHTIDLTAGHPEWNTPDIGVLLYIILPAIRGSYEWSVLFYFDFVRLRRVVLLRDLARLFMRKLIIGAIGVGLFFWAMAGIVFLIGFRDVPVSFLFAFLPFFLVRSWLAVFQVRAFADGRFATVTASMGIIIAGVVLIGTGGFASIGSFVELKICLFAALVFLAAAQFREDHKMVTETPFVSLADWCRKLSGEPQAVNVGALEIARSTSDGEKSNIRRVLEEGLGERGHCAWRDPHAIVYYQRRKPVEFNPFDPLSILEAASGLIAHVHTLSANSENGRQALSQMHARNMLAKPPSEKRDTDNVFQTFKTLFQDGSMADINEPNRSDLAIELGRDVLGSAIPAAIKAHESGENFTWCGEYRVYPLSLNQKLRAIFFVPAGTATETLAHWNKTLKEWSLSQSGGETNGMT